MAFEMIQSEERICKMEQVLVHSGSTSEAATAIAKANTKTDTKPEVQVRSLLHRRGYRFRNNYYIKLPTGKGVRPDIVFTKKKLTVFIDGCFCPLLTAPYAVPVGHMRLVVTHGWPRWHTRSYSSTLRQVVRRSNSFVSLWLRESAVLHLITGRMST